MSAFVVSAGKYDDHQGQSIRNCKFIKGCDTLEQAEQMLKDEGLLSYPWYEIEDVEALRAERLLLPEVQFMNFVLQNKKRSSTELKNDMVKKIQELNALSVGKMKYQTAAELHNTDLAGASFLNVNNNILTRTDDYVVNIRLGYGKSTRPTIVMDVFSLKKSLGCGTMIFNYPDAFIKQYSLMTQFNQRRIS